MYKYIDETGMVYEQLDCMSDHELEETEEELRDCNGVLAEAYLRRLEDEKRRRQRDQEAFAPIAARFDDFCHHEWRKLGLE